MADQKPDLWDIDPRVYLMIGRHFAVTRTYPRRVGHQRLPRSRLLRRLGDTRLGEMPYSITPRASHMVRDPGLKVQILSPRPFFLSPFQHLTCPFTDSLA
jgi:hypothetical protein